VRKRQDVTNETIDERLRRVEILVAALLATQTAMLAVGGFLAIAVFNHLTAAAGG